MVCAGLTYGIKNSLFVKIRESRSKPPDMKQTRYDTVGGRCSADLEARENTVCPGRTVGDRERIGHGKCCYELDTRRLKVYGDSSRTGRRCPSLVK